MIYDFSLLVFDFLSIKILEKLLNHDDKKQGYPCLVPCSSYNIVAVTSACPTELCSFVFFIGRRVLVKEQTYSKEELHSPSVVHGQCTSMVVSLLVVEKLASSS